MDANEQPDPPVRHFVREWNEDGTVKGVVEVSAFHYWTGGPPDDSGWVPAVPGVKQITFTVEGYMTKGIRPPDDE